MTYPPSFLPSCQVEHDGIVYEILDMYVPGFAPHTLLVGMQRFEVLSTGNINVGAVALLENAMAHLDNVLVRSAKAPNMLVSKGLSDEPLFDPIYPNDYVIAKREGKVLLQIAADAGSRGVFEGTLVMMCRVMVDTLHHLDGIVIDRKLKLAQLRN